jgi:hypothetical protein
VQLLDRQDAIGSGGEQLRLPHEVDGHGALPHMVSLDRRAEPGLPGRSSPRPVGRLQIIGVPHLRGVDRQRAVEDIGEIDDGQQIEAGDLLTLRIANELEDHPAVHGRR